MNCLKCDNNDINGDDNFCSKCGHWTTNGYSFLKDENNVNSILDGQSFKQNNRFSKLIFLFLISIFLFVILSFVRKDDFFKPYYLLKKQINNFMYGYKTTIIKTDNIYSNEIINSELEAKQYIINDFEKQNWLCENNIELKKLEMKMEEDFSVLSINFCDMSLNEAIKIKNVIENVYSLFPGIKGYLTNITITNSLDKSNYVALFQPKYQFVNSNSDINEYNKVNKTQILLNSYYYLNDDIILNPISNIVGENFYVNDATWESAIAHELGHYIVFYSFLKNNGSNNILFETKENYLEIKRLIELYDSKKFQNNIVKQALDNYNFKYNENLNLIDFSQTISKYASTLDNDGLLNVDETIAEAIHDYYLHGDNCKKSSYEIINVIKKSIGEI